MAEEPKQEIETPEIGSVTFWHDDRGVPHKLIYIGVKEEVDPVAVQG